MERTYHIVTLDGYISNAMSYREALSLALNGETDCIRCHDENDSLVSREFFNNGEYVCLSMNPRR